MQPPANTLWRFDAPPHTPSHTVRAVVDQSQPVLMVSRNTGDGAWHFLTGDTSSTADALLVSLQNMLDLDPSLQQLADLAPGWMAWRQSVEEPWERQSTASQTDD